MKNVGYLETPTVLPEASEAWLEAIEKAMELNRVDLGRIKAHNGQIRSERPGRKIARRGKESV